MSYILACSTFTSPGWTLLSEDYSWLSNYNELTESKFGRQHAKRPGNNVFFKILNGIKTPESKHSMSCAALLALLIILYLCCSDGQFSLLFTFSSTVQTFGFGIIVGQIRRRRVVSGLSQQCFISYSLAFGLRAILFVFHQGYLPNDATGDEAFRLQEFLSLLFAGYVLHCIRGKYRGSYDWEFDMIHSRYLAAVALMMSIIFHSNLNYTPWADLLWSFTQYLEASAILSQFGLFYSKGCDIDTHTSQFVVTQSVSRVIALIFWLGTYKELNELDPLKGSSWLPQYAGYWFLLMQFVHFIVFSVFIWYWCKATRRINALSSLLY